MKLTVVFGHIPDQDGRKTKKTKLVDMKFIREKAMSSQEYIGLGIIATSTLNVAVFLHLSRGLSSALHPLSTVESAGPVRL